jgi:transcriptional regulator of arginine metabolism
MSDNQSAQGSAQRKGVILQLVRSGTVRSQVELRQALRRRGIVVAQPTLSRDLRELGLAKTPSGYVVPEAAGAQFAPETVREAKLGRALRMFALSVQAAGSLVVILTPSASAHPMARALDEATLPSIVGTVAGDDTVFVATPGDRVARALARQLRAALEQGHAPPGA